MSWNEQAGTGLQWLPPDVTSWRWGCPGRMYMVGGWVGEYGQGDSPYHVTYPMMHVVYLPPPVNRTTDRHIPVKTLSSHNMPDGKHSTFSFPSCTIQQNQKVTRDKGCLYCWYYWICAQIFRDKHFATNCFQLSNAYWGPGCTIKFNAVQCGWISIANVLVCCSGRLPCGQKTLPFCNYCCRR